MFDLNALEKQCGAHELDADERGLEYTTLMLCGWADVFSRDCIGYWARGQYKMPNAKGGGWILRDDNGDDDDRDAILDARRAVRDHTPMPEGFHFLDQDAARRVWEKQLERWGTDGAEVGDYDQLDWAIQMVLLGEDRYA